MPKAFLCFDLPEEREEYELAVRGPAQAFAWQELDEWLRRQLKYRDDLHPVSRDAFETVRAKMREIESDRDLSRG